MNNQQTQLICPNCKGNNVNVQMTNEVQLKRKHHGFFWWLFIGIWWVPIKWILFTVPALIFKIFGIGGRSYKTTNIVHKHCVCQSCGYSWEIK